METSSSCHHSDKATTTSTGYITSGYNSLENNLLCFTFPCLDLSGFVWFVLCHKLSLIIHKLAFNFHCFIRHHNSGKTHKIITSCDIPDHLDSQTVVSTSTWSSNLHVPCVILSMSHCVILSLSLCHQIQWQCCQIYYRPSVHILQCHPVCYSVTLCPSTVSPCVLVQCHPVLQFHLCPTVSPYVLQCHPLSCSVTLFPTAVQCHPVCYSKSLHACPQSKLTCPGHSGSVMFLPWSPCVLQCHPMCYSVTLTVSPCVLQCHPVSCNQWHSVPYSQCYHGHPVSYSQL